MGAVEYTVLIRVAVVSAGGVGGAIPVLCHMPPYLASCNRKIKLPMNPKPQGLKLCSAKTPHNMKFMQQMQLWHTSRQADIFT